MEKENVYVVFEKVLRSCDTDYENDGFVIVWDCDEVGRNLTTCELIEEIGKHDDNFYSKVINYCSQELNITYDKSNKDLNHFFFDEVFEFLKKEIGEDVFYKYEYQLVSLMKEIYFIEQNAKDRVKYCENSRHSENEFYYTKIRVSDLK